ncbi:hypothetical protein UPYG_G00087990 [Umbra pygmaea]|uniref:Secreted protein n=1 Tax=Umbra pygmaea TaxID=75934 RepID=A0ABD0XFG9_UMBPY
MVVLVILGTLGGDSVKASPRGPQRGQCLRRLSTGHRIVDGMDGLGDWQQKSQRHPGCPYWRSVLHPGSHPAREQLMGPGSPGRKHILGQCRSEQHTRQKYLKC